jgi:hypothetical protein
MALRGRFTPIDDGRPMRILDPERTILPAFLTLWVEPPDVRAYTLGILHAGAEEKSWTSADWRLAVGKDQIANAPLPRDLGPSVRLEIRSSDPGDALLRYVLRRPPGREGRA